ncbi:MAG: cobalamin biosynthesis protein CobD [Chloroflexi bacterium]|nr:cobalamin biosynthesis protein CobD [Chloroflexota bacterium]MYE41193.1 cobalamin biosynthesis protein CobD [Chloroflexota bacterium]
MEWRVWPGEWYLDAGALLIALALDLALRELPSNLHPVVWMGKLVSLLERVGPSAESKAAALAWGGLMAVFVPVLAGGLAWLAANGLRELGPVPYLVGVAALLSTTFAVKGLAQAAKTVQDAMGEGSMGEARYELRSLVSRDANSLDQSMASAAAIESVAENTTDSYIAPWLAFALLGLPGAFAFRAVNTLDSMIGYRGRYEYLGKASARLDDAMNLIPARVSAAMMLAAGALCRLPAGRGWRWALTGRRLTASPNAGWTIGAMSGLLGVALEKSGHYRIGEGLGEPGPRHIGASIRVAYAVAAVGIPVAVGVLTLRGLATG